MMGEQDMKKDSASPFAGKTAQEIASMLGGTAKKPSPPTKEAVFESMVEQDVSTNPDDAVAQFRTAYLTGEVDDATYTEVFNLLTKGSD